MTIHYRRVANQYVCFDSNLLSQPDADFFTADTWRKTPGFELIGGGRGGAFFFQHAGQTLVLRHYFRGGLVGRWVRDHYMYPGLQRTRAWREFHLLRQMLDWQLPVPTPVAARVIRYPFAYQADIVLQRIAQAQNLHQILLEKALTTEQWRYVGQTIARFHQRQVYHHDLNIQNIMLDQHGKVWLIDFDKCRIRRGDKWKQGNIERLRRSLEKEQRLFANYHLDDRAEAALLLGYHSASR